MKIKALIMDVDGTLTDGGIYLDSQGNELKKFNVKDGYAIAKILPQFNIVPIILTGRKSDIVEKRCRELGIKHIIQGSINKVIDMRDALAELSILPEDTMYIGDDINDLECMKIVSLKACPADAAKEIKNICDYVSQKEGGQGAVRDIVDWLDFNWR